MNKTKATSTPPHRSPLRYFLLVFALSAPLWILQTFIRQSGLPLDIPITDILAAFMPLLAACLLVRKEGGGPAVRQLLRRIFDLKRITQARWYVAIFLVPLVIFIAIYGVLAITGSPLPNAWNVSLVSLPILLTFFFLGAVGEEVGYMGYAFEPMQKKWGALGAALIIGLPWAVWHYPSILAQGHDAGWIFWGTIGTIAVRVLIVWIYNNTQASLFAAIAFHALYNTGRVLFPQTESLRPLVDNPAVHYGTLAVAAAIVACIWGPRTLARYKLQRRAQ